MRILGITDGQTSGAAIVEDGTVTWAINEERLVRMKQARGAPRDSLRWVLDQAGIDPEDIDAVAIAERNSYFKDDVRAWRGWFEERAEGRSVNDYFFRVASRFGGVAGLVPGIKPLYYKIRAPMYRERRKRWPRVLGEEFGVTAPSKFYHHHYCHATSAYFTSGFDRALVVSMDGGGDGSSSHIYRVHGTHFEPLCTVDSYDSLGNYYAYITAMCGYKAKKHEGKITGLAAHGEPIYYDLLGSLICERNGAVVNTGRVLFNEAMRRIERELPEDWTKADLAASIQKLSEDVCRAYVGHWLEKTGERNLTVAGGIFANVRINQELNELGGVDRMFVHPGMSDEGLAVGAAYAAWRDALDGDTTVYKPKPVISTVYFGPEYGDDEIEQAMRDEGCAFEKVDDIERQVAERLAEGYVVARFAGRMEYGPRALGNRSILYHPTDRSVNDWLNKNLVRTEFMPFAPSVIYEDADKCFEKIKGSRDTARFMTITYRCTPWMREACRGVIHLDGTVRPQLVRPEDNPSYYRILTEFKRITALPCIINTSFNMHEEPIVCSPADAIRAFKLGHLDYLAIGSYLVKNPGELLHELRACKRLADAQDTDERPSSPADLSTTAR